MALITNFEVVDSRMVINFDWDHLNVKDFSRIRGIRGMSITNTGASNGISYTLTLRYSKVSEKFEAFTYQSGPYSIIKKDNDFRVRVDGLHIRSLGQLGYRHVVKRYGVEFSIRLNHEDTYTPDASFYTSYREPLKRTLETKPVYVRVYNGGSCSSK